MTEVASSEKFADKARDLDDEQLRKAARLLLLDDLADSGDIGQFLAIAREAAERTTALRPFDVQLLGALRMLAGDVVEMATGEGKTLSGAIAAAGYALAGRHVHVVTINDYLARRDAEWMGPLIEALPSEVISVQRFDSFDDAVAAVRDGDIPAAVHQDGDVVELRYSATDQVSAGTVQGIVQSVVGRANLELAGTPPRFTVDSAQVEDETFEPIQYLTSGLLAWAVAMSAAAVIVAHNHPSGNPRPSGDDLDLTARLDRCGELLGIALLDHLVVGDTEVTSIREYGWPAGPTP